MNTTDCTRCGDALTTENWTPGLRRAKRKICRRCQSNMSLLHYHRDPDKYLKRSKQYLSDLRTPLLAAYGSACACCGDSTPEFLTIDHIANDGNIHRKALTGGTMSLYRFLRDRGYPKEGFQLLCWNCNCSKYMHGRCPHQVAAKAETV